ncbi:MAG: hypothetical protein A4E19_04720 [Nitrospira sp. SG-bin1]|nr:MAG: hypothetical protein A4E19_04720 [Nitrospira sp. SG-bin1]
MDTTDTKLIDRVRTTLERAGMDCPLEHMMDLCPELTWNQMFFAIDDLSRRGEVRVTMEADRTYRVQVRSQTGPSPAIVLPDSSVPGGDQSVS